MLCRVLRANRETLLICKFDESFQNYFKRKSLNLITLKDKQRRQEYISYQEKKYKSIFMGKNSWEVVLMGNIICCTVMHRTMTFPSTIDHVYEDGFIKLQWS